MRTGQWAEGRHLGSRYRRGHRTDFALRVHSSVFDHFIACLRAGQAVCGQTNDVAPGGALATKEAVMKLLVRQGRRTLDRC